MIERICKTLVKYSKYSKYLEYVYYIIILLLVHLLPYGSNFLIKMITLDGLYTSLHSIFTYINAKPLTESQLIEDDPVYNSSLLDRYIYYIIQYVLYKGTCLFLWKPEIKVLYYIILTTLVPPIFNWILKGRLFDAVRKRKESVMKIILSKQIASLVQFTSKTYLNKEITIHHKEMLPLFDNYNETITHLSQIATNTAVMLVLNYVRTYSRKVYYKLIKYAYNFKMGENARSYTPESARKLLTNIVDKKDWEGLLNANVHSAIITLYKNNNKSVDVFKKIATKIQNKFTKTMAIYTISSFFKNIYIIPTLSTGLFLYNKKNRKLNRHSVIQHIIYAISPFVSGDSYLLTSLLCQFGYEAIFNSVVSTVAKYVCCSIKNILLNMVKKNWKYCKYLLAVLTQILIYNKFGGVSDTSKLSVYISTIMFMLDDINKMTVYLLLLLSGYISNFNTLHLISNISIAYLGLAYRDYIRSEVNNLKEIIDTQLRITKKINGIKHGVYSCVNKVGSKFGKIKIFGDDEKKKIMDNFIKSNVFELSNTQFIDAISVDNDVGSSIHIVDDFIKKNE